MSENKQELSCVKDSEGQSWILHIDGDAFFASCEVSRRPDLFGKPVVVGEERGIVTALTYPAKALGIKRGDPIFKIKSEYPEVTILSSHFELYRKFAHSLANILKPDVDKFEAYSIDECFATISGTCQEVQEKIINLKEKIQKKLGITYSFGVSKTKTLAKVASKLNKPNGIVFLMSEEKVLDALKKTKIESIWGVGWATERKLRVYRIKTAFDFINADLKKILGDAYGKNIFQTHQELLGIKFFEIGNENPHKKSIQATRSFLKATNSRHVLYSEISRNVEVACNELRREGLVTKNFYVFIKPKIRGKQYIQKSFELPFYTASDTAIMKLIEHMFDKDLCGNDVLYKKSGVYMSSLKDMGEVPNDLFKEQEKSLSQEKELTGLVNKLRCKYGYGVIGLCSSLQSNINRSKDYKKRHKMDTYESGLPFAYLGIIT